MRLVSRSSMTAPCFGLARMRVVTRVACAIAVALGATLAATATETKVPNPEPNTFEMGHAVAIDGNTAVLGAPGIASAGIQRGAAIVLARTAGTWQVQQVLRRSGNVSFGFGDSVDVSGDTVIVGTRPGALGASDLDRAAVFTRAGATWTQQAILETGLPPPGPVSRDAYSPHGVAIDGDTAIVATGLFAVHVFVRNGGNWTQQAKIVNPDAAANGTFVNFALSPRNIAISGDTIAIGAPLNPITANPAIAAVYVFTRTSAVWTLQAKITRPSAPRAFGTNVSLDGDNLLVGNYLYTRSGGTWTESPSPAVPAGFGTVPFSESYHGRISGDVVAIKGGFAALAFRRVGAQWMLEDDLWPNDVPRLQVDQRHILAEVAVSGTTVVSGYDEMGGRLIVDDNGYLVVENPPGAGYFFELPLAPETAPPGAPTAVSATVTGNKVTLTWDAPTSGAAATAYTIVARAVRGGPVIGTLNAGVRYS